MKPQFEIVINGDNDLVLAQQYIGKEFTLTVKRFPNRNAKILAIAKDEIAFVFKEEEKKEEK